jgi:cytochrome c
MPKRNLGVAAYRLDEAKVSAVGALLRTALLFGVTLYAGTVAAQDGSALMGTDSCTSCHAIDQNKAGPSFDDIANKYRGNANAEKILLAEVGGAQGHPKVSASDADIKTIIDYVLKLH